LLNFFQVSEEKKEFAMGITCLADCVGVGLAGAIAIPVHDALCKLPLP
jgi:CLN3 protein.